MWLVQTLQLRTQAYRTSFMLVRVVCLKFIVYCLCGFVAYVAVHRVMLPTAGREAYQYQFVWLVNLYTYGCFFNVFCICTYISGSRNDGSFVSNVAIYLQIHSRFLATVPASCFIRFIEYLSHKLYISE